MEQKKYFFAVDLGATSGRTIIGSLSDGKFNLEELTRFDNHLIETGNHFYWDIYALYLEIIKGLNRHLGMRLCICGQGRSHPPQPSRLSRPTYSGHDGEILRRANQQGKGI